MKSKIIIIIPARYSSGRIPGKPLVKIAGKEILKRSWEIANTVASTHKNVSVLVATEDHRVISFCKQNNMKAIMTSKACRSGTERCKDALEKLDDKPDFVINSQVDNFCPPRFFESLISFHHQNPTIEAVCPYLNLSWSELDELRDRKSINPFYGTSVVFDKNNFALWFSKKILPAIRKERAYRKTNVFSPVNTNIGLIGYKRNTLEALSIDKAVDYGKYEGLEQLDLLEDGVGIKMLKIDHRQQRGTYGVHTLEDIAIAEELISKYGGNYGYLDIEES